MLHCLYRQYIKEVCAFNIALNQEVSINNNNYKEKKKIAAIFNPSAYGFPAKGFLHVTIYLWYRFLGQNVITLRWHSEWWWLVLSRKAASSSILCSVRVGFHSAAVTQSGCGWDHATQTPTAAPVCRWRHCFANNLLRPLASAWRAWPLQQRGNLPLQWLLFLMLSSP